MHNLTRTRLIEAHLRRALELMMGAGMHTWDDQEQALDALVSGVRAYRREELEDVRVNEVFLTTSTRAEHLQRLAVTDNMGRTWTMDADARS